MKTVLANRWRQGLVALSCGLISAGCGQQPPPGADAAAEPTSAWTQAFNAGDPASLAALYAENARSLPPGGPAVVGRDAIEAYWREDLGEGGAATSLTPVDVLAEGDLLHVEGTYQVTGRDGAELAAGQYQQLWAQQGTAWHVQREMWRIDPALHRDVAIAEDLTSSWTTAYNSGDAKAVAALYADDAAISSVQDGTFSGKTAIDAFWARDLAGGTPMSTLTLTDVYMAGEMLHLEGDYKVAEGSSTTEGRFIQMWMRDGSGWRVHREMWWR
jgi:ketosteroid isomerase-like protein